MRSLPKVSAILILWGLVGLVVWRVEPAMLRDVGIPGLYLPMVGLVTFASWYSALIVTKSWKASLLMSFIVAVALITLILRFMNWLIAASLLGMVVALGLTLVKKS